MKVGILTFPNSISYGATLQMYALYHTVNKLGHEAEIINYQNSYVFDANGVLQDVEEKKSDAITGVVDGYYYKDGQIQYGAGPIEWNGAIYYVRSNGQVATGKYWTTVANDLLPAGIHNFDDTGKLIKE